MMVLFIGGNVYAENNNEDLLNQALRTYYEGNYGQSEQLWLEIKEEEKHDWEVNFFLGMINLNKNDLEKAVDYMEKAYNLRSENYFTLVNYARILYRQEKHEMAFEILNEVPEGLQKYNEQYYNTYGLLEMTENNLSQAVEYFEIALEINPENYYVLNNLGLALIRLGNFQQAKEYLEMAIELDPTEAYIYNNLGITYENLNQLQQAKESYQKALELNPLHERAEVNLNRVIFKME